MTNRNVCLKVRTSIESAWNQTAVHIWVCHNGVCLTACFLTLQVQLSVLRPHLRQGIQHCTTNKSLSAHQPTCRAPKEEGVRGVTLAPGCANSRQLSFYQWLIHYQQNLFASCRFRLLSLPSFTFPSFYFALLLLSFSVWCAISLCLKSSFYSTFSAPAIETLSTEP